MFSKIFPKIHTEGYKFLVIAAFITIILFIVNNFLGLIGLLLTIWVYYFFRDPERVIIRNDDYLVSPADGEIIKVEEVDGPKEVGLENKTFKKISIFMNVFDCHVNRSPCTGQVEEISYIPGKFFNASLDKASEDNERNYYKIKNTYGEEVIVVQIAGLIARRIVCETSKDTNLKQGDGIPSKKFTLQFGSVPVLILKRATLNAIQTTYINEINHPTFPSEFKVQSRKRARLVDRYN